MPQEFPHDANGTTELHRSLARDILLRLQAESVKPGEKLSRLLLSRELGVSRTPVNGAIALLANLGVVRTEGRAVRLVDPGLDAARLGAPGPSPAEEVADLMIRLARDRRIGTLPDEVSERDLLQRYSVRTAILQQALRQLLELGAVGRNRGHGWRFQSGYNSAEERRASHQFRLIVEPAALREAGFRLDQAWVSQMEAQHREVGACRWEEFDAIGFFELNAAFHQGLADASGNRFLGQAVQQQNRLRRFSGYGWSRGAAQVRQSVSAHLDILQALKRGDREAAAAAMTAHIQQAATLIDQPLVLGP
ncbi:GntR family transcriptional regulator [Roseomonas haemaphysalidis]|uniref:GntR family transcriptional regulator n=1 Tax=Roseomonas haemaphysalidis TaxID=2768162 RepID=A0ABS3KLT5_9PROT|nr:GntR family transcriptional regulator [Roseomonas haemaphysalidis]MBO1078433.1 GntR family transcriptional regulator [Roseomonas haemaphysalidis]